MAVWQLGSIFDLLKTKKMKKQLTFSANHAFKSCKGKEILLTATGVPKSFKNSDEATKQAEKLEAQVGEELMVTCYAPFLIYKA